MIKLCYFFLIWYLLIRDSSYSLPLPQDRINLGQNTSKTSENRYLSFSMLMLQNYRYDLSVSGLSLIEKNDALEIASNFTHVNSLSLSSFDKSAQTPSEQYSSPFYVNISDQRFYGGIIEMNHALYPASVCRVLNACIRRDNTLVLPNWMRRHERILSNRCGYTQVEFSLPDYDSPPEILQRDLLGLVKLRPSMPHFITDFMPNAIMLEFIGGNRNINMECHTRQGSGCDVIKDITNITNPVIQLHHRLKNVPHNQSWVLQFVKLMTLPNGKSVKVYFPSSHDQTSEELTCFRSALFTREAHPTEHVSSELTKNMYFFRGNGINRDLNNVMGNGDTESGTKCQVNITITNRIPSESSLMLKGRFISNIPALRRAISKASKKIPQVNIHVKTLTLEGKSLQWQINAMQKTDLWIAGHGPLLTNMIFLREKSFVVEIQPFSYYPSEYEKMAESIANVRYVRYIANPDLIGFQACVEHMYPEQHPLYNKSMNILRSFNKAVTKYSESSSTHSFLLHTLNDEEFGDIKTCARMQRLGTNPKDLASTVLRLARIHCDNRLQGN